MKTIEELDAADAVRANARTELNRAIAERDVSREDLRLAEERVRDATGKWLAADNA